MSTAMTACTGCSGGHYECLCHPEAQRGVLLINLGTPDGPDVKSVRRYLTQFLGDPFVIKLPRRFRWLNYPLARMIAQFRAPRSAEAYRAIWTDAGSPLKVITARQAAMLQAQFGNGIRTFYAMRYANPGIPDTLRRIIAAGITELTVLPMYPQYSGPTTGTALQELYRILGDTGLRLSVKLVTPWYDDVGYIEAQARLIHECAVEHGWIPDNSFLLYSTHSLPHSYVAQGDPYEGQVRRSMELITARLGWPVDRTRLSFQSKLGPVRWLEPATPTALRELAESGEKRVIVCPISFTADCLETLEEIGIRYAELFAEMGGELALCPALNDSQPFIKALAQLARRGARLVDQTQPGPPLFGTAPQGFDPETLIDSLLMVGVSVAGRLASSAGPRLRHVAQEQFRRAKQPQAGTPALLERVHAEVGLRECWMWNTCNRYELYGLLNQPGGSVADGDVSSIKRLVFQERADDADINVLQGRQAWHHLIRTACGLNSTLPGDTEVLEQLQSAFRMARHGRTAGSPSEPLIERIRSMVQTVRSSTAWGEFATEYCYAALVGLLPTFRPKLPEGQCVVIGGSTTSVSLLRSLVERFEVPSRQITVIYRGERRLRLLKLLRKWIGAGRRQLVQDYTDRPVLDAVAGADFVFLGIDRKEPILRREQLEGLRNFDLRPLTIVDFNAFGSTTDLESLVGVKVISAQRLEQQVADYSHRLRQACGFSAAVEAAERRIQTLVFPTEEARTETRSMKLIHGRIEEGPPPLKASSNAAKTDETEFSVGASHA